MGFLDRLHDVATASFGALEAPVGYVKDLVFDLPELGTLHFGDFLGDFYKQTTSRAGQAAGNLIGPQGITGSLIGGLPEQARQPFREIIQPTEQGMDLAYHELVGKPISAAITAGSLADRPGGGGLGGLFRGSNWAEGWNIAEHRSPGQSLALAFLTKDVLNPDELERAKNSQVYNPLSGTFDAITRLTLDPTSQVGAARAQYLKGLWATDSQAAVAWLEREGHYDKLLDEHIVGKDAATIRHTLWPGVNDADGAWRADVLANADKLPAQYTQGMAGRDLQKRVLRALSGAADEIAVIKDVRPDVGGSLERMFKRHEVLRDFSVAGEDLANHTDELEAMNREIAATQHAAGMLERLNAVTGKMDEFPHPGMLANMRAKVTLGDFYQTKPWAKPVRWVFDMEPTHMLNVERAQSDAQVWRQLQKSSLPLDRQLELRSRYLASQGSVERAGLYSSIENEIVDKMATDAGVSRGQLDAMMAKANEDRGLAQGRIDSRTYDGAGRSVIEMEDAQGALVKKVIRDEPIYETQLPKRVPMVDLDRVEHSMSRIRSFLRRNPGYPLETQMMDAFRHAWKPSVLIHGGFAVRINTDEFMRVASQIGTLATAKGAVRGGLDAAAVTLKKAGIDLGRDITGNEGHLVGPYAVAGIFGPPGDKNQILRPMMGARESLSSLVDATTGDVSRSMMSGSWRSIDPTDPLVKADVYEHAFEHAGNNQIGRSALGRQLLEQMQSPTATAAAEGAVPRTVDEIVANTTKWLQGTPEGQDVLRAIAPTGRTANIDKWLRDVAIPQIDAYLPSDEMKAAAWKGSLTHKMLVDTVPDIALRPVIHGGILNESMGGPIGRAWNGFVDKAMNVLVAKPNEFLIRNNFADHLYHADITRQIALRTGERQVPISERIMRTITGVGPHAKTGVELDAEDLHNIEAGARRYALNGTKSLLHDYAEHPRAAKMLGMLSPFYAAWSQVLGRWAGITIEHPDYVRRLRIIWRSPERAGLVTDGAGNVIGADGRITTPVKGGDYKQGDPAADEERNVTIRLPGWAHNIPGLKIIEGRYRKDSLNLLAHGYPPVGPFVQAPLNAIAKQKPELLDSLKWALPYGTYDNVLDTFKPTILRRIEAEQADPNGDVTFRNMAYRLYTDRVVDFQRGIRHDKPSWDDALKDARAYAHVRTLASLTLPSSPTYASPYQPYIDALHARRELDAKLTDEQRNAPDHLTPDEWFLDTYGAEFFPLVASMSKSIDAVPPTLEGNKVHEQYADLLAKFPEIGGLIVGAEGAGAFNDSVYRSQFGNRVGPGSDLPERRTLPFDEYKTEASTSLGWMRFSKAMDLIDALQHQRGLSSLYVNGAQDLLALKQGIIDILAHDPSTTGWYEDYSTTDTTKWDRKLSGMVALAGDARFADRQDVQGLQQYLKLRNLVVEQLAQRGVEHLRTKAASDIAGLYDATVSTITDHNPAFAALYHRWLQNDPVATTPVTDLALAGVLQ